MSRVSSRQFGLIALAGVNASVFQLRIKPLSASWDREGQTPAAARASAALSIVLWIAIIIAGRMMAYLA